MKTYGTYRFINKDPIIDKLRTLVKDSGVSLQYIENKSGVSQRTLYNWFHGVTLRPQHCTVAAVVRALGYDVQLVKRDNVVKLVNSA